MYQLLYWLGAFAKTISLLSLIILIPQNPYTKQLLSKGFLLIYVNEIILFLIQSLVNMFSQPQLGQYFPLSQVIMNIYFFVIVGIVVVWLLKYQKQVLSQEMTSMSVVVTIFVWMAVVTVGLVAVATKDMNNVRALGELTYSLGWMICLLKFIIQYRLNTQTPSFGLGFIFLFTNIAWSTCQLLSKTIQQQAKHQQTTYNFTTMIFVVLLGIGSVIINVMMVNSRKQMLERTRQIQRDNRKLQEQVGVGITDSFIVDERERQRERQRRMFKEISNQNQQQISTSNTLKEPLMDKQGKYNPSVATTKYSTSFAQSIENY